MLPLACSFLFCVVPVCLFLLPLFVWQAQFLLAGMGVNGPDAFLVSLLGGLF